MDSSLEGVRAVFLDLDGTIYLGGELIPGALEFLSRCEKQGIQRYFLSNNSSRSVEQYVTKLHKMNIPCTADVYCFQLMTCYLGLSKKVLLRLGQLQPKVCAK